MAFWVVTWMEDGSGKLVGEMPDHGLKTIPGSGLTQITQVDIQDYSNNVGMYPVHQFFHSRRQALRSREQPRRADRCRASPPQ